MDETEKAAEQYEIVLSGKATEMNPRKGKGKVSLQVRPSFLPPSLSSFAMDGLGCELMDCA